MEGKPSARGTCTCTPPHQPHVRRDTAKNAMVTQPARQVSPTLGVGSCLITPPGRSQGGGSCYTAVAKARSACSCRINRTMSNLHTTVICVVTHQPNSSVKSADPVQGDARQQGDCSSAKGGQAEGGIPREPGRGRADAKPPWHVTATLERHCRQNATTCAQWLPAAKAPAAAPQPPTPAPSPAS